MIRKQFLSRRTVLRGAGVALSLPLLDAMIPAMTATAQTAASAPTNARMVVLYDPVDASTLNTDCTKHSRYPGSMKTRVFLRRPDVPGFCPSKGPFETDRLNMRPYVELDAEVVHRALDLDPDVWLLP